MAFLLAVGLVVNICNIGVQCNTDTNYSSLHECLKSGHRDSWLDGWKHSEFGLPGNLKKGDRFKLAPKIWRFDMSWISIFQRFVSLSVLTCRVVIQELSRPQRPERSTSQFALKGTQIETRSSLKQFKSMRPTFTRVKFRVCLKLKLWLRGATSKASSCQNFQVQPEKYAGSAILYYTILLVVWFLANVILQNIPWFWGAVSYWGRGPWSKEVRSDSLGFSKECNFSMLVSRHDVGRFVSQPWQSPPRILALQAPDTCKFVYSSCPFVMIQG